MFKACIRREIKNDWERRAPLTPAAVAELARQEIPIWIEPCGIRVHSDEAYRAAGALFLDSADEADVVLGIKEPTPESIQPGQVHVAFSHTIKGQPYNMPLLQRFLDRGATLIDYETMKDDAGKRIIAFGRYAGIAGAVETFAAAGRKLAQKSSVSRLTRIQRPFEYGTVERVEAAFRELAEGFDEDLRVVVVGTGKVGRGSEEVCRWLGLPLIEPARLLEAPRGPWVCVLGTADIVAARNGGPYDKGEYRQHGVARYRSVFAERFLGKFNVLLQTPYWEDKYPRLLTREEMLQHKAALPSLIGDISCDINGSLASTLRESTIDDPVYTYRPESHTAFDGISWEGPTVMAIDHLPCELAQDATADFSRVLATLVPEIARMDLSKSLETCGLSPLLQRATIVYKGRLTPEYAYLEDHLAQVGM